MNLFKYICLGLMLLSCGGAPESVHCDNCPSQECICILDGNGVWVISPEVGE